jgi:transposase InsO family protein
MYLISFYRDSSYTSFLRIILLPTFFQDDLTRSLTLPFYSRRESVVFPNVLNREFCAEIPSQKLITDIAYVRVGDTFAYLSSVLDLYNNEIVAWELSERNDLELVWNTLKQLNRKPFGKKIGI